MNITAKNRRCFVIAALLLVAGAAAGSVYLAKNSEVMSEGIKTYLSGFFSTLGEGTANAAVFKNSLVSNLLCAGIIFLMGFFRFGCIVTGAILVREGFVAGFTAASFFKFYGAKGMLIMLSTMPAALITIPMLLFFSVISIRFSLNRERKKKNLVFFYVFFLILTISIFCVASLCEGYMTTTFMKWIYPKIA